jgi:hypothetical protein
MKCWNGKRKVHAYTRNCRNNVLILLSLASLCAKSPQNAKYKIGVSIPGLKGRAIPENLDPAY